MKIIRFFLKVVLYIVLTFVFVVIFEYGIDAAPSKMGSSFSEAVQKIQDMIPKH